MGKDGDAVSFKADADDSKETGTLADWLQHATHATILTGAGMSTESDIPDFRSKEGWWNRVDPRTVATPEALQNHYDLFHEFYAMRIKRIKSCTPHTGYNILADWEKNGLIQAISTQNVDGFHTRAGNEHVYELHGSLHQFRCAHCARPSSEKQFLNKENCQHCGGHLRPGVVLFGETLPEDSWKASLAHIRRSDLVIVIGTSLKVYPASELPNMTEGKTVYINAEVDHPNTRFDLVIKGKAGEVLQQVNAFVTST